VDALLVVVGDQHSAYGRTAQLVGHIDRLKVENPGTPLAILINGDSFEYGNVVARRSEGAVDRAMLAAFARRAPTILNLGNHEPEFWDVASTVSALRGTGVIVVGNVRDRSSGQLFAPAATRLQLGAVDMVIAGITTDILAQYRAHVRPSLDLTAPGIWAREKFPELLSVAPVKVVLSHAGLRLDRSVFPFVPDGALVAGAHDHAQYVERMGRFVYFHSGSWNSHLSVVRLSVGPDGPSWEIEQHAIQDSDPADRELETIVLDAEQRHLRVEDLAAVGQTPAEMSRVEAAAFAVEAVRQAAEVDAAFVGNTTFGDGLPAGNVSQFALDACVRFDGTIWIAEITGARLRALLREANQGPETPFGERRGDFQFAAGPNRIVDEKRYRIATNDWGVRNRERYFGAEEISFSELPELRLKAVVREALNVLSRSESSKTEL
jgi:2',3'-cyclic-nucleotide 2'-phosphodiesterase (5'-nucleotidase family)